MNAILLINEDDDVVVCVKPLSEDEAADLIRLSRTLKGDGLCYRQMALFAIRRGDRGYRLGQRVRAITGNLEELPPTFRRDQQEERLEAKLAELATRLNPFPKNH